MATLTFRERLHLIGRALVGSFDIAPDSVGGQLLSRIYPGTVGDPPKRGTDAFLRAYSESPWLAAVSRRVGTAIASAEWKLYSTKKQGAPKAHRDARLQRASFSVRKALIEDREAAGDLNEITSHPLLDALDKGNAALNGLAVRKITQVSIDMIGEGFWLKERGPIRGTNGLGIPVAFWPIPATWVIYHATISHPFYRVSFRGWQVEIAAVDMLWFKDADPVNPYGRGAGVGQALADELDTDEYAARLTRQFFANSARPDLIISPKGDGENLKPENVARLEQQWTNQHQGLFKAFKPFFASRAIDVKEIAQDFRALQLVELRQHERDTILQVYGPIPPEMLGIVENSNRATIAAAQDIFARWTLVPRLEFWRTTLQESLVPEYDERLILDYESPIPADEAAELEAAKAAPWSLTQDEWRQKAGFPPVPGGKGQIYMVPTLLTPMEILQEPEPVEPMPHNPDEVVPPAPDPNAAKPAA